MSETKPEAPILSIEGLTLTLPGGRCLLNKAELQISSGEFVLLVGPSGSGKSTLLRMIAGLDDPETNGTQVWGRICIGGAAHRSPNRPPDERHQIGLVFQNHALFDELSPVDNVQFAIDHRSPRRDAPEQDAFLLLSRLGVPAGTKLAHLSGGERQRVAVARTLAMDPAILLFDEPTTGLDPMRAADVAGLIVETHSGSEKTTLVVTHDYRPFLCYHPRIILLDPNTGSLLDVDEASIQEYFRQEPMKTPPGTEPAHRISGPLTLLWSWLDLPGSVSWAIITCFLEVMGSWSHPKWKMRYLWHYLRMVSLGTTTIYVAIAGTMLGFVFVFFSFSQLPYVEVTTPLLTEEFLAATGYTSFRVVVPLMIAVLMAGKCGASIAADVGARRLTHQFDALRSFGVRPQHYLYGNIVAALVLGCPLMTFVGYAANWYASLTAYLLTSEEAGIAVFQRNFFATVWPMGQSWPTGLGWVVVKSAGSGLIIAALGYTIGSRTKTSSVDVSRDVGITIFWSTLGVLMLHAGLSFVEF